MGRGNAEGFGLTPADLGTALHRSVSAWNTEAKPAEIDEYLDKLRADDLVLALACAAGNERAWESFVDKYRPVLSSAANALIREEAAARDLADSLWADLYGMDLHADQRRSLLVYYGGRSSLGTWLHAVTLAAFRRFDARRGADQAAGRPPARAATGGDGQCRSAPAT